MATMGWAKRARLIQQLHGGGRSAGLGVGVEEAAEGDIAGAFGDGALGQFQLGVAGTTDHGICAKAGARGSQRAVGLAQVQADAQPRSQLQVIVDDQRGTVALTQFGQRLRFIETAHVIGGFVAVLQQARATDQRRFGIGQQFAAGQQRCIGDGVEAAQAHWP